MNFSRVYFGEITVTANVSPAWHKRFIRFGISVKRIINYWILYWIIYIYEYNFLLKNLRDWPEYITG